MEPKKSKKPPKLPLSNSVPWMEAHMSVGDAYHSGYYHGYTAVTTRNVCCLTRGTSAEAAWHTGYTDGEADAAG